MGLFNGNKGENKESQRIAFLRGELQYRYGINQNDFKNQNVYTELLSAIENANTVRNTRLTYDDRTDYSERVLVNTELVKISQNAQISRQLEQLIELNKQILEKDRQILEKLNKEKEVKETKDIVDNIKIETIEEKKDNIKDIEEESEV